MNEVPENKIPPVRTPGSRRKRLLTIFAVLLILAGSAGILIWALEARHHESTDDAYVAGDVVQITPQLVGTVLAIHADDTDLVKAGAPLVDLDPADARIALDQAEAALAQAVREVRALYTNGSSLAATVTQREADLAKNRDDLERRQALAGTGAVSGEEILHARSGVLAAEAALRTAREQLLSSTALTDSTTVENHPNVARAAARVEEAYLALRRATISAPVAGQVAKRNVQVGTRVAPGQPLMAIVPLDRVWVDANFKEGQLRQMRVGQAVTMVADLYGSQVRFTGRVVGFGAGTGAAFALLPAQNATGNWIKIVQRVPVRIAIDSGQIAEHPLRLGMSMAVDVDVRDQAGKQLTSAAPSATLASLSATDKDASRKIIRRILSANGSGGPAAPRQSVSR